MEHYFSPLNCHTAFKKFLLIDFVFTALCGLSPVVASRVLFIVVCRFFTGGASLVAGLSCLQDHPRPGVEPTSPALAGESYPLYHLGVLSTAT